MKSLLLINPQWQGGAETSTFHGAKEIEDLYLKDLPHACVPVSESCGALQTACGIIGYADIRRQTDRALEMLNASCAERLVTIGGGCDADAASILHHQKIYSGHLTALWMDAHAYANAPEDSESHLFYGMPVRMLLGGCARAFPDLAGKSLSPDQFVLLGARDVDPAEQRFLNRMKIPIVSPQDDRWEEAALTAIHQGGRKHLCIHLDLDVLSPDDFPYTPLPVAGGLHFDRVMPFLRKLDAIADVVGIGIFEYRPAGC